MQIAFIGTGYVGLVTGTCFAELGHNVVCVDVDERKIANLREGILPIYEPGLEELVSSNASDGRLTFTTDLSEALEKSDVVFVAVGTPQRQDGSANLDFVWAVTDQIRKLATSPKVIVIKSTVPVGTNEKVFDRLNSDNEIQHSVASNPEFLREGLAIGDALNPDRVVLGINDDFAREQLTKVYQVFSEKDVPILFMNWESSEMTKYVANCMLATKISYINEMSNMCESVGADVTDVRQGIGHDKRIGFRFLAPGVGYGGSCFPKDVRAMKAMARERKMPMRILEAVDYVNEDQKRIAFQKLSDAFGGELSGKKIAVWGLAFKPETDDIREAPSIILLKQLLESGTTVNTYDPAATENVQATLGDVVEYCEDKFDAIESVDALVILTEWDEFTEVNLDLVAEKMKGNVVIDGRNIFSPSEMADRGFVYSSVGRETAFPSLKNSEVVA